MNQSTPLNLEKYGIFSFSFELREEIFERDEKDFPSTNMELNVGQKIKRNKKEDNLYLIELKISVREKENSRFPYRIDLRIWGLFSINNYDNFSTDKLKSIVAINGSSILYGIAREYIFIATCHCLPGSFNLPTVSFIPEKK